LLRIPLTAPPRADLTAMIQGDAWTLTMHQRDPSWGVAEKSVAVFMVQFTESRRERWIHVIGVASGIAGPPVVAGGGGPRHRIALRPCGTRLCLHDVHL
jgi:hypothetical protein